MRLETALFMSLVLTAITMVNILFMYIACASWQKCFICRPRKHLVSRFFTYVYFWHSHVAGHVTGAIV